MFSLISHLLGWLTTFYWVVNFLAKVIAISCVRIELIPIWIGNFSWRPVKLRLRSFCEEIWTVCGRTVEWLHAGIKLLIFISESIFRHAFVLICALVPRLTFERNVFFLILDSRHHLLSHLRLVARIIFPIGWIDVAIWCIQVLKI